VGELAAADVDGRGDLGYGGFQLVTGAAGGEFGEGVANDEARCGAGETRSL